VIKIFLNYIENGQYIAFEWIGPKDYLGKKKIFHNGKRTCGVNFTSADAAVMFKRSGVKRQMVLIEKKL
jgi:hypothetical protein